MVPDRQSKIDPKEWWSTGRVHVQQPGSGERNEWKKGKKGEETTLPPHRVRTGHGRSRGRQDNGMSRPAWPCYKRAAATAAPAAAAAGLSDPWMRAGSVLRRRSDKNAKPVFLISRRAKRFREVPAEEYGDPPPVLVSPSPRALVPFSEGHQRHQALGDREPRRHRGQKEEKRCVRLHDSKTRCRGGVQVGGYVRIVRQRGLEGNWQGWPPQTLSPVFWRHGRNPGRGKLLFLSLQTRRAQGR